MNLMYWIKECIHEDVYSDVYIYMFLCAGCENKYPSGKINLKTNLLEVHIQYDVN